MLIFSSLFRVAGRPQLAAASIIVRAGSAAQAIWFRELFAFSLLAKALSLKNRPDRKTFPFFERGNSM
ncbi:hypothetical protein [Bosea vaviloviae]|uniref:Uncharacterized protein n=1 Tax=Bosea vaviloviae TaxID=1526658 RepID=A0A1D7U475_9HYPH|nr:hypothetical protein [Bosea vaviloviae]AOO82176.1 hypothetical protein BHK69_18550 [Bosea vaviloviae]